MKNCLYTSLILVCFWLSPFSAKTQPVPEGERLRTLAQNNWNLRIGNITNSNFPNLPDANKYKNVLKREFSTLTMENQLKWTKIQPQKGTYDWEGAEPHLAFAEANNMTIHGHALVWYTEADALARPCYWLPYEDPADAEALMLSHIEKVMNRYKNRVEVWDVVNEAVASEGDGYRTENLYYKGMKAGVKDIPNYIRKAFRKADAVRKKNDDDVLLLYNDFGFEWKGKVGEAKRSTTYEMLEQLLKEGVPIDGLGMQTHVNYVNGNFYIDYDAIFNFATRVAQNLGLKVYITELDVRIPANTEALRQQQADVYAQILERFLRLPNRGDFTLWGFTDKYSWLNPNKQGECEYPAIFYGDASRTLRDDSCPPVSLGMVNCPAPSGTEAYQAKPAYYALQRVLAGGTARRNERNALAKIEAESHDAQRGVQTQSWGIGYFEPGDYLKYAKVDFGGGANKVTIRYATLNAGQKIEFRLGTPSGQKIGEHTTQSTGSWSLGSAHTKTVTLNQTVSGVKTLYIRGAGVSGKDVANLDWIRFENGSSSAADYYLLQNKRTGRYMHTTGNDEVAMCATCTGDYAQWELADANPNKRIDVKGSTGNPWLHVDESGNGVDRDPTSSTGDYTRWRLVPTSGDYYYIESIGNGKRLHTEADHRLDLVPNTYQGDYVQWKLVAADGSIGRQMSVTKKVSSAMNVEETSIRLYPNPSQGQVTIEQPYAEASIRVFNPMGQVVWQQRGIQGNTTLSDTALPAGLYTVEVSGEGSVFRKKLLVE